MQALPHSKAHSYLHRLGRRRSTQPDRQADSGQNEERLLGPCSARSDPDSPDRRGSPHGTGLETHTVIQLLESKLEKSIYLDRKFRRAQNLSYVHCV